jgi:hypothetical protein
MTSQPNREANQAIHARQERAIADLAVQWGAEAIGRDYSLQANTGAIATSSPGSGTSCVTASAGLQR